MKMFCTDISMPAVGLQTTTCTIQCWSASGFSVLQEAGLCSSGHKTQNFHCTTSCGLHLIFFLRRWKQSKLWGIFLYLQHSVVQKKNLDATQREQQRQTANRLGKVHLLCVSNKHTVCACTVSTSPRQLHSPPRQDH